MPNALIVTQSMLKEHLAALGLSAGQCVMLHVSTKSMGWLVGGPDILILSLIELLGPSGTLVMYVGWEDGPYTMADWPAAKREAYLRECPGFDPQTSRAVTDWSVVAERLRTWPGAKRSRHPDGSFCAIGPNAPYITDDHALKYGYGEHSPLAKLLTLEGKILNIGAPLNTVTLLHHAEDRAQLPHKRTVTYQMPIKTAERRVEWVEIEEFDTTHGLVDWYEGDYFTDLMITYIAHNQLSAQKVGQADSYLFDAVHLHRYAVAWMETHLVGP